MSFTTQLIILRGINMRDILNTISLNNTLTEKQTPYHSLPKYFENLNNWPISCNLACWWCSLTFDEMPKFIPQIVNNIRGDTATRIAATGVFCSWNCAIAYVDIFLPERQRIDAKNMIYLMVKQFTGRKCLCITPSPHKSIMAKYCGESGITDKEYREKINDLQNDYISNNTAYNTPL